MEMETLCAVSAPSQCSRGWGDLRSDIPPSNCHLSPRYTLESQPEVHTMFISLQLMPIPQTTRTWTVLTFLDRAEKWGGAYKEQILIDLGISLSHEYSSVLILGSGAEH